MALKKIFAEVGAAAGSAAATEEVKVVSARRGEEEGAKFGLEQGKKAGEAAARKLKDEENKLLKEEGGLIGEQAGGEAGEKAGIEEGEKFGGEEAERIGGDEGERIGREIAGEEVREGRGRSLFYLSSNVVSHHREPSWAEKSERRQPRLLGPRWELSSVI